MLAESRKNQVNVAKHNKSFKLRDKNTWYAHAKRNKKASYEKNHTKKQRKRSKT